MDAKLRGLGELILAGGTDERARARALIRRVTDLDDSLRDEWYRTLSRDEAKLWSEVRAVVSILAAARLPPPWSRLEDLGRELTEDAPNRSWERWYAGLEERFRLGLGGAQGWSKEHARFEGARLLLGANTEEDRKAFMEIVDRCVEDGRD